MAEITIADLLTWDHRFALDDPSGYYSTRGSLSRDLEREVTWGVTLRASMPILPPIRGGEVVIMPDRILSESGVRHEEIMREVVARGATGVIVDGPVDVPEPLVAIWSESIPPDLESDINRLLTEQRGLIYQRGTDLGRMLSQANALGASVGDIVQKTADALGVEVAVAHPRDGVAQASAGFDVGRQMEPDGPLPTKGWVGPCYVTRLVGGSSLFLGPVNGDDRAMVRIVAERIAVAVESAQSHANDVRPRGNARSAALAGLLMESSDEVGRVAGSLGLPSNGVFQVVLAGPEVDRLSIHRELSGGGTVHDAGEVDGFSAILVEYPTGMTRHLRGQVMPAPTSESAGVWTVYSTRIGGTSGIPTAAGQARFLASLVQSGLITPGQIRFDSPANVGIYRLLFPLWGSGALQSYAADTLGDLIERDRRGILQETLLAFLESGGSQIEAARLLGVHRNTLAYRLKQIGEMTGANPTHPHERLSLHVALIASKLPPSPRGTVPAAQSG